MSGWCITPVGKKVKSAKALLDVAKVVAPFVISFVKSAYALKRQAEAKKLASLKKAPKPENPEDE